LGTSEKQIRRMEEISRTDLAKKKIEVLHIVKEERNML
jgi:hypothetical protein